MRRILLINNDITHLQSLMALFSMENFDTDVVDNTHSALDKIKTQHYHFVLLNITIPKSEHLEILKQFRDCCDTPIMILSDKNPEFDHILFLESGADIYLTKPFNSRELIAYIKIILRRTSSITLSNSNKIEFCGIKLYLNSQQAIYQGRDLNLTMTEFMLLKMFVKSPGQIFSRETLSTKVLNKKLTPYDRAIDMHISNLRKKLPKRTDNLSWFKTSRGKGYLLLKIQ
ncbi:winged helix-turn-helix domain-containing protein [Phocoenobacter skyensis]|uniref:Two-component system, OmpR family, response regulator CpxR n=1 Tax=Phocoenobacter skyensis TaxID=97481 RepID=A0A1H7VR46_9PAST|nr:winged helix-turn-helix domain-containing protein [Pasteurella skyensis]MDP8078875.1 winged helix-turn-helix domain-containing protein [Pasteurella skyensis]MDP8084812.1 winged helix-turn-helix domain-containing protein [Pasteurella skyensis]MDP8162345.1 winged helix-turn-helix domain-containing protein [Pasteurella skyensis]MDP8169775.1 winged helix-turn-helix domain-containing protein [Pasteurella skyensis]MDP8172321.1 winged helix-turn-helix domain-containing protein [Pasteurella skyensi